MSGLSDFTVGDTVVLSRVLHPDYQGQRGVVHRVIKSKGLITIHLPQFPNTCAFYRAKPENLDKVPQNGNG